MPPSAIVTGGAGFIGSHMVDLLLERGLSVRVIDNLNTGRLANLAQHRNDPRCDVVEMDMRTIPADSPLFQGVDFVFHFGGMGDIVPSIEKPVQYMEANVNGTLAVVEAARYWRVKKLVYAASSSCYGASPGVPTSEAAAITPEYPYALSKYLGECVVLHWGTLYRLPVNSIRIFNAYGPRARTTGVYGGVFGVFLAQRLKGQPLTVVGDGTQTRDFVYVTDVARAFLLAAESPLTGEIFNLGTGQPQSVKHLVELLGNEVVHLPKRPGEPDCTWADTTKICRLLGWRPTVSFEEGVAAMLQNIDYWADAPVWTAESIADATKVWFEYLAR